MISCDASRMETEATDAVQLGPGQAPYQVICVCAADGYPLGSGSASRITMIGRALRRAGIQLRLLHCGPSPVAINTERKGVYEGIPFEYPGPVKNPKSAAVRKLAYAIAALGVTYRLVQARFQHPRSVVYLYVLGGPVALYIGLLCRVLGLPTVQEICEWPPDADPVPSRLTLWLYRKPLFVLSSGALVISKAIERNVEERAAAVNPNLATYRLPCVVDPARFSNSPPVDGAEAVPHFVWCGTWIMDIPFLVRAFASVRRRGYRSKLTIIGRCVHENRSEILSCAAENGLAPDDFVLAGCVDDPTLAAWYKSAVALLLPMRYDGVSRTRMPNKLAEYLASGRPVVTCPIGEQADFLKQGVNAYLAEPGNEAEFADQMARVLEDPETATRVGAAGQRVCLELLDYRAHSKGLANLFSRAMGR